MRRDTTPLVEHRHRTRSRSGHVRRNLGGERLTPHQADAQTVVVCDEARRYRRTGPERPDRLVPAVRHHRVSRLQREVLQGRRTTGPIGHRDRVREFRGLLGQGLGEEHGKDHIAQTRLQEDGRLHE